MNGSHEAKASTPPDYLPARRSFKNLSEPFPSCLVLNLCFPRTWTPLSGPMASVARLPAGPTQSSNITVSPGRQELLPSGHLPVRSTCNSSFACIQTKCQTDWESWVSSDRRVNEKVCHAETTDTRLLVRSFRGRGRQYFSKQNDCF